MTYDIIGDVHGELPALRALGAELGYDVDGDWRHAEGRIPVFLGDLVDRGAHGLEVAELVHRLVEARRGFCVMGNHEYNLVAWYAKVPYAEPKTSNATTIAEITRDLERGGTRWPRVLGFFRELPVAVALPDLRLIHACWHVPSLAQVSPVLAREVRAGAPADAVDGLERHVVLRSPFDGAPLERTRLLAGLPGDTTDHDAVIPHEDLMKGFEVAAPEPFRDNYGKERKRIRALWWASREDVLVDRPQVFGHYWNLPPVDGQMAPPHPSGHPLLRAWASALAPRVPASGRAPMTGDVACVDFHGVTKASDRACIGALRWPEREIVWATARKTATEPERD